jgi:hypothetical protein
MVVAELFLFYTSVKILLEISRVREIRRDFMPTIESTSIHIKANDGQVAPGSLQTTHYDHSECVKRALLRLGLFWLLALVSSPIVIAHFVLVPGFLIAGPWMAYRTLQKNYTHNRAQGECPVCQKGVEIQLESGDELPKWTYCPSCSAPLHLFEIESTEAD